MVHITDYTGEFAYYNIWARGAGVERIGVVDIYSSFKCSLKWADVSTWELVLPYKEFIKAFQITPPMTSFIAGRGIVVFRNGTYLIAGPITEAHREKKGDDDMITLSGADDTFWLTTRLVWPYYLAAYAGTNNYHLQYRWCDTSVGPPPLPVSGQTLPNVHASTNMRTLVKGNIGADAITVTPTDSVSMQRKATWEYPEGYTRKIELHTDPVVGKVSPYFSRWETLLTACKNLSNIETGTIADECGFGIRNMNTSDAYEDGCLTFNCGAPVDRTDEAIFGVELGTIINVDYTETFPDANNIIVGGPQAEAPSANPPAEGIATRFYTDVQTDRSTTSVGIYGLIEGFYDFSTDSNLSLADQYTSMRVGGVPEANDKCYNITVKIGLQESAQAGLGTDYWVGDIVTVQMDEDDNMYTDIIRAIDCSVDPSSGEVIECTVCSSTRYKSIHASANANNALARALSLARNK